MFDINEIQGRGGDAVVIDLVDIDADALLKATKVDGVYSDDPMKNKSATRYESLSFDEAISKRLGVMDITAFSMCRDNKLPIIVFNFSARDALVKVLSGDFSVGSIVR